MQTQVKTILHSHVSGVCDIYLIMVTEDTGRHREKTRPGVYRKTPGLVRRVF